MLVVFPSLAKVVLIWYNCLLVWLSWCSAYLTSQPAGLLAWPFLLVFSVRVLSCIMCVWVCVWIPVRVIFICIQQHSPVLCCQTHSMYWCVCSPSAELKHFTPQTCPMRKESDKWIWQGAVCWDIGHYYSKLSKKDPKRKKKKT